ncbi:hypothetical protein ECIAI39_0986 [Escherichia coli IAI39]|uniref:Uncharacterized protein n=1 Tax=Escherichia coli O7:K1 (strain IAI39 / ExPEC) TaxID=585057 RepID=A0A0H3MEV3_ECO7I|nr:hypothetical protein ECIAI39_0986 [Escherichia coli IAI39]
MNITILSHKIKYTFESICSIYIIRISTYY